MSISIGLTYDGILLTQLQRIGQMMQFLDVGFSRGGEGQVRNFKAFVSPVLERDAIEVRVFGRDNYTRLLRGIVPAELHPFDSSRRLDLTP